MKETPFGLQTGLSPMQRPKEHCTRDDALVHPSRVRRGGEALPPDRLLPGIACGLTRRLPPRRELSPSFSPIQRVTSPQSGLPLQDAETLLPDRKKNAYSANDVFLRAPRFLNSLDVAKDVWPQNLAPPTCRHREIS